MSPALSIAAGALAPRFEAIFRSELGYVWKALQRFGVPARDLEDVAHDVLVAVYRHLGDYDTSRPIRPWLCGFAYRAASDYRKLARHRYEIVGDDSAATATIGAGYAELEARDLTLRALQAVELERRIVLVLHDIDGYAMPEIAAELSIPVNTAYSRLRLARNEFRLAVQELQQLGGES